MILLSKTQTTRIACSTRQNNGDIDFSTRALDRKATRMFVALSIADKCVLTRMRIMRFAVKRSMSDKTTPDIYESQP